VVDDGSVARSNRRLSATSPRATTRGFVQTGGHDSVSTNDSPSTTAATPSSPARCGSLRVVLGTSAGKVRIVRTRCYKPTCAFCRRRIVSALLSTMSKHWRRSASNWVAMVVCDEEIYSREARPLKLRSAEGASPRASAASEYGRGVSRRENERAQRANEDGGGRRAPWARRLLPR
jgi:hypothetical protein